MGLIKTKHAEKRLSQRGFRDEEIELAYYYGEFIAEDRIIFGRRHIRWALYWLGKDCQKNEDKIKTLKSLTFSREIILIVNENNIITAYKRSA